jgi:sugar phosphate isomerase/epimerase
VIREPETVNLSFPPLPRSLKRAYRFRTSAPSFVYPADYVPNARRLAPFFDEVELLFFESAELPPRHTITELSAIGAAEELGYNVHLPTDVSIAHPDPAERDRALDALQRACELAAPLRPSAYTLHVPDGPAAGADRWREHAREGITRLVAAVGHPAQIAVETLDYPPEQLGRLIAGLGVSICIDVGHLLLQGRDPAAVAAQLAPAIAVVHLHAACAGRDHLALDRLLVPAAAQVIELLTGFRGVVSLEVFSLEALTASMEWLAARFRPFQF